jgi:uncharacterized protein
MKPRISLITLGVTDLKRSTGFYTALGFTAEGDGENVVFFKLEGTWLSLFPKEELAKDSQTPMGEIAPTFSLAHNVVSKEKVHEVIELARSIGAAIVKEPQDVFWGGYSAYFKDPDGYLWEVAWNPFMDLT